MTGSHKLLIVEDDLLIAEDIKWMIENMGYQVAGIADNSDAAIKIVSQQQVDLALMDINISGETDGIATALILKNQYSVPSLFVSAFSDFQTIERAKIVSPLGFIVKPIHLEGLRVAIEMAFHNKASLEPANTDIPSLKWDASQSLFIKNGNKHSRVTLDQICYLQSMENYVIIQTDSARFIVHKTLKELESKLPHIFFKTHRSYIVNLNKIKSIEDDVLVFETGLVPVARALRDDLKEQLVML